MKLYLDKVGIISNSNVVISGLTVVTGKNSSGKTTVGRVLYSIVSATSSSEEAFERSKINYIVGRLENIKSTLGLRGIHIRSKYVREDADFSDDEIITVLLSRSYNRFDLDEILAYLDSLSLFLKKATKDMFLESLFSQNNLGQRRVSSLVLPGIKDNFDSVREEALLICDKTIDLVNDESAFNIFLKDRIKAYLNYEFNNQVKPIKAHRAIPKIKLSDDKNVILDMRMASKDDVDFGKSSLDSSQYDRCIFIDDPYVLDSLDYAENSRYPMYYSSRSDSLVSIRDIDSHSYRLSNLLLQSECNFFENVETQIALRRVFEKVNEIVPGEFQISEDGLFYVDDGARLSIKNLATGSKTFFIIKKLLLNGYIDEKTILVLDEPESHLHPEWINRFAEILVLLASDVKVKILLTTHSPNLMLALKYYSQKSEIAHNAHFYLAERKDYYSTIKCIDNNIGEGYSHLSLPLIEMNLMMNALDEERT